MKKCKKTLTAIYFNTYLLPPYYEKFGKYKDQLIYTFENLEEYEKYKRKQIWGYIVYQILRKGQVIYSELQRLQETHPETKHAECSYYYHVKLSCCDKSKAWWRLSRLAESSTMSNWRGEDVVQHRPLVAAIRIEVTSENTEALSWFSIANQITVTKKLITTLTIFIVFFLNVFIFESGKESRCSFISYMRKKNKHHIHNDNQYSFATKRLFVEYKWFEWSELTHPHKQTNRLPSPPRADYRCEGYGFK